MNVNVNIYKSIDEFSGKVGGSLRLTALIVSRARQIIKKAPVFVDAGIDDPVQTAFLELMEGKIRLKEGGAQPPQIPEPKIPEDSGKS